MYQSYDCLGPFPLFNCRVAELELQLQTMEQQKQEASEKLLVTAQQVTELHLKLNAETQQKLEAVEKVELLTNTVVDMERRLEEQRHALDKDEKQVCNVSNTEKQEPFHRHSLDLMVYFFCFADEKRLC